MNAGFRLLWPLSLLTGCPGSPPQSIDLDWQPQVARSVSYQVTETFVAPPLGAKESRSYTLQLDYAAGQVTVRQNGTALHTFPVSASGDLRLQSDNDPLIPLGAMLILEALPEDPLQNVQTGVEWQQDFPTAANLPDDKHARQFRFLGRVDSVTGSQATISLRADQRRVDNARFRSTQAPAGSLFKQAATWSPAVSGEVLWDGALGALGKGDLWFAPIENPDIPSYDAVKTHPIAARVQFEHTP